MAIPTENVIEPSDRKAFVLAGKAEFTLYSVKTESQMKYRVQKSRKDETYFVSRIQGAGGREFIGCIFQGTKFWVANRKPLSAEGALHVSAFAWFWRNIESTNVVVQHHDRCAKCGGRLTDPESIRRGIGPVCRGDRK